MKLIFRIKMIKINHELTKLNPKKVNNYLFVRLKIFLKAKIMIFKKLLMNNNLYQILIKLINKIIKK